MRRADYAATRVGNITTLYKLTPGTQCKLRLRDSTFWEFNAEPVETSTTLKNIEVEWGLVACYQYKEETYYYIKD